MGGNLDILRNSSVAVMLCSKAGLSWDLEPHGSGGSSVQMQQMLLRMAQWWGGAPSQGGLCICPGGSELGPLGQSHFHPLPTGRAGYPRPPPDLAKPPPGAICLPLPSANTSSSFSSPLTSLVLERVSQS